MYFWVIKVMDYLNWNDSLFDLLLKEEFNCFKACL